MNRTFSLAALLVLSTGCGGGDRLVTGRLDLASLGRSEARIIAAQPDQRLEAPISGDGRFSLSIPTGTWALAFADTEGNGRRVFANLIQTSGAERRGQFTIEPGDEVALGSVHPAPTASALTVADDNGGGDEAGDDNGGGDEAGDDNGGNGEVEPEDDSGDDRRDDCRGVDDSGGISRFASFLVVAEDLSGLDTADQPDDSDTLSDQDDDGRPDVVDEDQDGDDVCDDDGDSEHGDDDSDAVTPDAGEEDDAAESDLPYAVELEIGATFRLADAFAEKGPQPAEVLSVEMEGGRWRLAEIESLQSFTVDTTDCEHEGNRGVGRDRIYVSWRNSDGSFDVDHLDLRYCGR